MRYEYLLWRVISPIGRVVVSISFVTFMWSQDYHRAITAQTVYIVLFLHEMDFLRRAAANRPLRDR